MLTAGVVLFAACKKSDNNNSTPQTGPTARAMFMNTVLNSDTLKVKINDTNQTSVAGMTYLKFSAYVNVRAGNGVKTTFYFPSTGTSLASISQNMTANGTYSYFAGGLITAPFIISSSDELTAPTTGKAKVRFVNLSPDNMVVDCYVGTNKLEDDMSYKNISSFKEVDPGTLNVLVSNTDNITLKGEINGLNIVSGKIYTFVFAGTQNGSGTSALKLTMINNN